MFYISTVLTRFHNQPFIGFTHYEYSDIDQNNMVFYCKRWLNDGSCMVVG